MHSQLYIESFNCQTSTARDSEEFWLGLSGKKNGIQKTDISAWPSHLQNYWKDQPYAPLSCKINSKHSSYLEKFSDLLAMSAQESVSHFGNHKMGVILSTTKGAIEDFVWSSDFEKTEIDPLSIVLETTLKKLPKQNFVLKQVVSNSCSSSHAAFSLAKKWIDSKVCDKVLVLAGDLVGPFIHSGFQSLKALSSSSCKPFLEERDGLVLGEAVTAILFSTTPSEFELVDVEIFNEAHTVTGPTPEGRGILNCIRKIASHGVVPDFAIAHGTATGLNDKTEDFAMNETQKLFKYQFPISGTKWSIGHTLGASGSVDLIAALMCLRHQGLFPLPGTEAAPGLLATNYQFNSVKTGQFNSCLVTSLGFGGTNGALLVRRSKS